MSAAEAPRGAAPRLLVLTPDFAPARGGIQALLLGLLPGMGAFQTRVLALGSAGAEAFDRQSALDIRRVGAGARLGAQGANAALNALALAEALRFAPDAIMGAHIVTSPASAVIRRTRGVPVLQYFHANEIGHKPRLAVFAARHADASIAVSSYTAGLLGGVGAPLGGVRLISPGVDLPRDPSPLPGERPTVLTVARLKERYKGHDVMIRALAAVRARVPDVRWIVIGEGPLRAELEQLARSHGVQAQTRFLGAVSDEERDRWLRRADVFAMPSRLPGGRLAGEGFGIVYLEASAYGKPVVAGNVGGAIDAVRDGETGILVDPNDASAVAEAISRLLLDPDLSARLGRGGAEHARALAWPSVAARVEGVLLELLGRAR